MGAFLAWLDKQGVLALAFAVVVGVALAAVVSSLVKDVLMPPIGLVLGGVDFSSLYLDLSGKGYPSLKAAQDAGAPVIAYGNFINAVITFVIVAFVVYLLARMLVKAPRTCPYCAEKIDGAATRCPHCTSELAAGRVA
ncbi:MAG TPA: MscL family protein [Candidatus Limnocylindria bacterium]|nr:MscL family protein [Candidatus Limnocylindria bacterium]